MSKYQITFPIQQRAADELYQIVTDSEFITEQYHCHLKFRRD